MSLFGKVKDELQEKIFKKQYKNNWWTKSVWKKLNEENDSSLIYEAINMVRNNVCKYEFKQETNSRESWKLREVTEISKKRYNAIKKGQYLEEALERILVACNDLCNQFNLLSGVMKQPQTRKSIDIIVAKNSVIKEMTELKEWNNTNDNPLLSALELLFDYFIYKRLVKEKISNRNGRRPPEMSKNLRLSVLAPQVYYDYYRNPEAVTFIKKAINENLKNDQLEKVIFSFEELSGKLKEKDITRSIQEGKLETLLPKDVKENIKNWFTSKKKL